VLAFSQGEGRPAGIRNLTTLAMSTWMSAAPTPLRQMRFQRSPWPRSSFGKRIGRCSTRSGARGRLSLLARSLSWCMNQTLDEVTGPLAAKVATRPSSRACGVIKELDFTAVVCVVRRDAYLASYGAGALDESLPAHLYLMSLDFVLERLALALDTEFGGGRARVIAESRGPKEDALLQYEFARLLLQGTSYISPSWFRQQFHPGITFEGKGGAFSSGLQLADLLARPSAEKVVNPESEPERWPEFRLKLCPGRETKNSVLGLKIVPWDESFAGIWREPAEKS